MSRETKSEITNPFYCGGNGELYYAHEDKKNRLNVTRKNTAPLPRSIDTKNHSMDLAKFIKPERQIPNPCRICTEWTPEAGCGHYLPDSETILLKAGYRIYKPGIDTRQKKFIVAGDGRSHRFESLAKAAWVLIHDRRV